MVTHADEMAKGDPNYARIAPGLGLILKYDVTGRAVSQCSKEQSHSFIDVARGLGCVDLQCVYDTWDITQDCQEDVDEEVCIAATLEEDT